MFGKDVIVKKWRIVIKGLLFCLAIAGIASCEPTPLVTIEWEPDGNGFIQYQTNDPANASQGFHILYPSTDHVPMTLSFPVEVIVKKVVGSVGGGYGIVFCAVGDQNYYKILISRAGVFKITKVVAGSDNVIRDWDYPAVANLEPGINTNNKIKVTRTDPAGIFTVYFNDVQETTFVDTTFSGGQSGFCVFVADKITEYFPTSTVDVRFQMLNPDTIP
jgi:hypothetical protein